MFRSMRRVDWCQRGCWALLLTICIGSVSDAADSITPLDSIAIMALGALDGRAVIKTADGKMHVLKLGAQIPGTKAVVTQILNDKLIVEDTIESANGLKQQTVWITKGSDPSAPSTVQRLSTDAPVQPPQKVQVVQAAAATEAEAAKKTKPKNK